MVRMALTLNHMVEQTTDLDAVFHALANGARRTMLVRLAGGELTVGELAQPLTMSLAAASKHLKVLERVGLVEQTVAGRQRVCRLVALPLAPAAAWLDFYERYWAERLDDLEDLFRPQPELDQPHLDQPHLDQPHLNKEEA
jgi:DNA-binding transcriptional ArsR family regulator